MTLSDSSTQHARISKMAAEANLAKQARQLELFRDQSVQRESLPPQTRELVIELVADLIAVVWRSTIVEAKAAANPGPCDE